MRMTEMWYDQKTGQQTHKPVTIDSTRRQTTTNGEDSSLRGLSTDLVLPRAQGRTLQPRTPCPHLTVTSMLHPPSPRGPRFIPLVGSSPTLRRVSSSCNIFWTKDKTNFQVGLSVLPSQVSCLLESLFNGSQSCAGC